MKKQIIYWLMSQRHQIDKGLKKKLLIGLGIAGAFVIVSGIALTYIGVKATTYLISQVPTQDQMATLSADLKDQGQKILDGSLQKNCISEIQAHLNINVWLSKSISENTTKITNACFGATEFNETNNQEGVTQNENYI